MTPDSAAELLAFATAQTVKGRVQWDGHEWWAWNGHTWKPDLLAVAVAVTEAINAAARRESPVLREAARLAGPGDIIDALAQQAAVNTERANAA